MLQEHSLLNILILACKGCLFLAFAFYGPVCILTDKMRREFERYGLSNFRILVGCLESAGALGILIGSFLPWMGTMAAGGLCVLMFLGVLTRIRMKDSFLEILPAFTLMALSGFVFYQDLLDVLKSCS